MFRRTAPKTDDEQTELLNALEKTRFALESARISFDNASEPELVDATVYEINSLQARYNYLLRRAREAGCRADTNFRPLRLER